MHARTQHPRLLPLRLPPVCVVILGDDAAGMIDKAEGIVRDNSFMEFRLDYLKSPATAFPKFQRFFQSRPECIALATCRRVAAGGKFKGSVASQLEVLAKARAAGFQLLDVEIETAQTMKPDAWAKFRAGGPVMLSFHDFKATRGLDATFAKMLAIPADYYKLATTAKTLYDNVVMMRFLQDKSHTHSVVGLCMGEQGIISRVLGLRAGSLFTFAAATRGEESAPGQVSLRTLHDAYRIEKLDAATKVYGVAGDPVSHSLSPQMMNTAFRRENVNAIYLALHAKTLDDVLACVRDIPIHGLSVTMPYKEAMVEHLDNSDTLTQKTGACNTVVRAQDGKLYGFNTDVFGIVGPLERRMSLNGAKVLVIGAGGAARAAAFGLKDRGAEVFIINRTPSSGQKLAREAHAKYLIKADLKKHTFDVIINATPVGMENGKQAPPLAEKEMHARFVFDLVYNQPETPLTKAARAAGIEVIPGSDMFVQQGARQFEIWTGKPAPIADMQSVVATCIARKTSRNGDGHK
jgi:3-dehydroquinate dehydratase / shikimate dehydrogenase